MGAVEKMLNFGIDKPRAHSKRLPPFIRAQPLQD